MAKKAEAPRAEIIEKVVSVYRKTDSISETALQTDISTTKVRKILITEGLWSSPRSRQIQELSEQGKSSSEIADILQISSVMVQNYSPYKKGLYDEPEKTGTAIRSGKYRERNRKYAQKTREREQQTSDNLNVGSEAPTVDEEKKAFAMQLHLELRNSQLDSMPAEDAKILKKYGAVEKSISRDIIVPSSLALHQLHYLINMAFGWTNSHLHDFKLPESLYQTLIEGKLLDIAPVFGYYLHFPNSTFNDTFWDDDYDESKSPRTWMKSKYLKKYKYRGYSEYWIENQTDIQELAERIPVLNVHPFRLMDEEEVKPRKVPFKDATLSDLLEAIVFDEGYPDTLKESLRLSDILSLEPEAIESAKASALATDSSLMTQYRQYRDRAVKEAEHNFSAYVRAAASMERLQKKAEPKGVMPITSQLCYSYDYGDGWEVDITLVREFGKDNRIIEDETATAVIADRRPVCIAKDGLNVLDDCMGISGYIDMLQTIHEGDRDEIADMKTWARSQGWTGRDVNPKHMI